MKRILLALALLVPTVATLSAAPATHRAPQRHHTALAQIVYLCDNGRTVVYRSSTDCPAMRRCEHEGV